MKPGFRKWAVDTAERAFFTFVEAFLGLLIVDASGSVDGLSLAMVEMAAVSGIISALAVVKASLAAYRDGLSPASLVSHD